jgi:hypothetical protein
MSRAVTFRPEWLLLALAASRSSYRPRMWFSLCGYCGARALSNVRFRVGFVCSEQCERPPAIAAHDRAPRALFG